MFILKIETTDKAFANNPNTEVANLLKLVATRLNEGRSGGFLLEPEKTQVIGQWELDNKEGTYQIT